MREIRLGILGFGPVGVSLIDVIKENHTRIMKEYGIDLKIKRVYSSEKSDTPYKDLHITGNVEEVIFGERIDIVCETFWDQSRDFVKKQLLRTIKGKKPVIISSKNALASELREIIKASADNKVEVHYDACIRGGIPAGKILDVAFKGDSIKSIEIVDGVNPEDHSVSRDFNLNIIHELAILALYSTNTTIDLTGIKIPSYDSIAEAHVQNYSDLGYTIKSVGILKNQNREISYYAGPAAVSRRSLFGNVSDKNLSITLVGEKYGRLNIVSNEGIEAEKAALTMFDDLMNLLTVKKFKNPVKINIHEKPPKYSINSKFIIQVPRCKNIENLIEPITLEEDIKILKISELGESLFLETEVMEWDKKEEIITRFMQEGIEIKSCLPLLY